MNMEAVSPSTSERHILLEWLGHGARRLHANDCLRAAGWILCALFVGGGLYFGLQRFGVPGVVLTAISPLILLVECAAVGWLLWRCTRGPSLRAVASLADERGGFKDELVSAWWFARDAAPSGWEALVLERGARTTSALDVRVFFPVRMPRSLTVAAVCGIAFSALVLAGRSTVGPGTPVKHVRGDNTTSATGAGAGTQGDSAFGPGAMALSPSLRTGDLWVRASALAQSLKSGSEQAELRRAIAAGDAAHVRELVERAAQSANPVPAAPGVQARAGDGAVEAARSSLESVPTPPADGSELTEAELAPGGGDEEEKEKAPAIPTDRENAAIDALKDALESLGQGGGGSHTTEANGAPEPESQNKGQTNIHGGERMRATMGAAAVGGGEDMPPDDPSEKTAESMLGKPMPRRAARMQRLVDAAQSNESNELGKEGRYSVTQAQAARVGLTEVHGVRPGASSAAIASGQIPVAYRVSVKRYFLTEQNKER